MNETLETLIQALREELQQYGEMLALLDQQQECVVSRAPDDVLETVTAIQAHSQVIQNARERREERRQALARLLGQPEAISFGELIPRLPTDYQPLVGALVEENNELLRRIQQRARQNHLLLSRSVELMQRFISTLVPTLHPRVYNETGQVPGRAAPVQSLYEAVG